MGKGRGVWRSEKVYGEGESCVEKERGVWSWGKRCVEKGRGVLGIGKVCGEEERCVVKGRGLVFHFSLIFSLSGLCIYRINICTR